MTPITAVHLPCRLDLLGGWSDQAQWRGPAAVLHGAFGWERAGYGPGKLYPLSIDAQGNLKSAVHGIGTGLGISSIVAAGEHLAQGGTDYRTAADAWEQAQGTQGGWQDAVGACEPGFKYSTGRGSLRNDTHPLVSRLVLFDTHLRRNSGDLGDLVRAALGMPRCKAVLEQAVAQAGLVFRKADADLGAQLCLQSWAALTRLFPQMAVGLPTCPAEAWGHKYVGAGGGGYGVAFTRSPEAREACVAHYRRLGLWATVPVLLEGVQIERKAEVRKKAA